MFEMSLVCYKDYFLIIFLCCSNYNFGIINQIKLVFNAVSTFCKGRVCFFYLSVGRIVRPGSAKNKDIPFLCS